MGRTTTFAEALQLSRPDGNVHVEHAGPKAVYSARAPVSKPVRRARERLALDRAGALTRASINFKIYRIPSQDTRTYNHHYMYMNVLGMFVQFMNFIFSEARFPKGVGIIGLSFESC